MLKARARTSTRPRIGPGIRGLSFNKMVPNILTLLALCAGLTAIRFAIHGKWEAAVTAILVAAIFDGLDGRIARLLHGTSKFGAELDSLSDFCSFGVAPAMVLYFWVMQGAGALGWAMVLLYAVCASLRLARFNTMIGQADLPPWAYNFFTGVPAPAAAGLVLLPIVLNFQSSTDLFRQSWIAGFFLVLVSFLMVSTIPTYSGKKFRIPHKYVLPILLGIGVLAAFLVTEPWTTISIVAVLYLLSIPLSYRSFARLSRQAHDEAPEGENQPAADPS